MNILELKNYIQDLPDDVDVWVEWNTFFEKELRKPLTGKVTEDNRLIFYINH
jgi:hypothetical protein